MRLRASLRLLDLIPSSRDQAMNGLHCNLGRLQAVEIGADLRIRPVRISNQLAANDALAVDDVGLRPSLGTIELGGRLVGVAHGSQVDVVAGDEAVVFVFVLIDADSEDGQVWTFVMEFDQSWHFLNARNALGPPEVEQDNLPPVAGQMNGR
jgi:hypothetical protein